MERLRTHKPGVRARAPKYKPVKAPLEKGCTVHEVGSPHKRGTITTHGPEVSEVVFPEFTPRFINNAMLINLGKDH